MTHVFISYAHEDTFYAKQLADDMQAAGLEVWWDHELLAGQNYSAVIKQQIHEAAAVIVLWSKHSLESDYVLDEAGDAKSLDKLLPVRIDDCDLPYGFGRKHTPDVFKSKEEYEKLLNQLQDLLEGAPDTDKSSTVTNLKKTVLDKASTDSFWAEQWDVMKKDYKESYKVGYKYGRKYSFLVILLIIAIIVYFFIG